MKKNLTAVIIFLGSVGLLSFLYHNMIIPKRLKYCQEYVHLSKNIKGSVNVDYFKRISEDFDIGANYYGYAVFKNPKKAWNRLVSDYQEGILAIQKEYLLAPLSQENYELYGIYGWQVTMANEEVMKQCQFISQFFDIYENSFHK